MSDARRRALAMRIVMLKTQVKIRQGSNLYDDELQELWVEARTRTQDELEQWLGMLEGHLARLPARSGAGQLTLDIPGLERTAA